MNPTGKVFGGEELAGIAELLKSHDCYAISDEVYEHLVFPNFQHQSLLAMPDMENRVLCIASAGKTFSLTGWKVGYAVGTPGLLTMAARFHQFSVFCIPPHLQKAVASGLEKDDVFFQSLKSDLANRHDRMAAGLASLGIEVLPCRGGYFICADVSPLGLSGTDCQVVENS